VLGAREISELLERHGLDARRSLGQNFVADPNTVVRIARLAGVGPGDHVVEVGPGLGSLTLALADTGATVLALEKDAGLLPVLREVLDDHGAAAVQVVEADALAVDWAALLGVASPWALVANLPYNVAVPIIMSVLEHAPAVQRLVVMVQKEVAERLVASPGGRTVGIPSMRVAWYAESELLGTVPPEVFVPRPRVTSALVGMVRRDPPTTELGPDEVFPLVETAYRQRRKMLRSTLGRLVPAEAFERAGVAPTARPEELGVGQWAALALAVRALRA
jgi:16S rRNA (adenine1518-N6/adenine1519-N6)-dimethyltransferase